MNNNNDGADQRPQYRLFDIPGYPDYLADIAGNIWSTKRGAPHRMSPKTTVGGYAEVTLTVDGMRLSRYVHSLILLTFHGERPEGWVACHGPDPAKQQNHVTNLRWDTPSSNMADFLAAGGWKGRKGGVKLTPKLVRTIRRGHANGLSTYTLADKYDVDAETIRKCVLRVTWKNVV